MGQRNWSRAPATAVKNWQPGRRVVDESTAVLSVETLRGLLEAAECLPIEERFAPTRWLFKTVWEAVHGKNAPLSSLWTAFRTASDNNNIVLDLYRKLSGDFGSALDEVTSTGQLTHNRCARSYVVSAQLRRWLNEVPSFVPVPAGWEPPELNPQPAAVSPPPAVAGTRPGWERAAPGARAGAPLLARGPAPAAPALGVDPRVRAAFAQFDTNKSGRLDFHELREALQALGLDASTRDAMEVLRSYDADGSGLMELDEFSRLCARLGYKGGGGGRRGATPPPARRRPESPQRPARTLIEAPSWADARTAQMMLLDGVLAQVRDRLYRQKSRAADAFRAWDRDGDGLLCFDEFLAGIRAFGMDVRKEDEHQLALGLEVASGSPPLPEPPTLDFAQFDALLDRHSAYARQPFGDGVPPAGGGGNCTTAATFRASAPAFNVSSVGGAYPLAGPDGRAAGGGATTQDWQQSLRGPEQGPEPAFDERSDRPLRGAGLGPPPPLRAASADPLLGAYDDRGLLPVGEVAFEVLDFVPSQVAPRHHPPRSRRDPPHLAAISPPTAPACARRRRCSATPRLRG